MVWINISFCQSSYHEDDWPFNRTIWNLCVKKVSLCFSGGPDIPVDCILCSTFVVWFLLSFYFFSFVLIDICFPSPFFSVVWHFFFFIDSFSVLLKLLAILTLSLPFCRLIFLFAWLYHFFFINVYDVSHTFCYNVLQVIFNFLFHYLLYFNFAILVYFVVFVFWSTGHVPVSIVVPIDAAVIGSLIILFETLLWSISICFISIFTKTVLTFRPYVKAGM